MFKYGQYPLKWGQFGNAGLGKGIGLGLTPPQGVGVLSPDYYLRAFMMRIF